MVPLLKPWVCMLFAARALAQSCNVNEPCEKGCCNESGFCGFGPEYCDTKICVADCERKAECDPGGFPSQYVESETCPLSACCSKWGFCGVTEEFCGNDQPRRPSCNSSGGLPRVVGYYEGWAMDRTCHTFAPEQIPKGVYTHLNYAYATIDPTTFEIRPASIHDPSMYRRLTRLKRRDPDLKVLISIGGWTFSDPGRTSTTFSDIAKSEENQRAFFNSLLSFMATYDFDGIDLDWEYPGSLERGGAASDYADFPKMISNLRTALKSSGGRESLSITLPASYYYLQHYDIASLEKHVDFFNLLSYDLHGTWDKVDKWSDNSLAAHTNLTEIGAVLDLLWRNHIKPYNVVLGTAFYGRGLTALDSECLEPGCPYSSGSDPQFCSEEIGVMFASEIFDSINKTGNEPALHSDAAVKVASFGQDQWIAYDDEETLRLKAEFAQSQCLGGVMAWAISRDAPDGRLSRALGDAAGDVFKNPTSPERNEAKLAPRLSRNGGETVLKHPQCMWTNCGDDCPTGYSTVKNGNGRPDSNIGPLEKETMVDPTACSDNTERSWCCPTSNMPTCQWSKYDQGMCRSKCSEGSIEIGSYSELCENGGYAAACCDGDNRSISLYKRCDWEDDKDGDILQGLSELSNCGFKEGTCPDDRSLVAESRSGSGDVNCAVANVIYARDGEPVYSIRPYCCDESDHNMKWGFCGKYGLDGHTAEDPGHCPGDCPSGRYRVSLDQHASECTSGAASYCCVPSAQTLEEDLPDEDVKMAEAVDLFMTDPEGFCSKADDSFFERRDVFSGQTNASLATTSLLPRGLPAQYRAAAEMKRLIADVLGDDPTQNHIDIFNDAVGEDYPWLQTGTLQPYMEGLDPSPSGNPVVYRDGHGIDYSGEQNIACALNFYNDHIGALLGDEEADPLNCDCHGSVECGKDGSSCSASLDSEDPDHLIDELRIRDEVPEDQGAVLEKRGNPRKFRYTFKDAMGNVHKGTIESYSYPSAPSDFPINSPHWKESYFKPDPNQQLSTLPQTFSSYQNWVSYKEKDDQPVAEHIFELAFVKAIVVAAGSGEFRGNKLSTGAIDPTFLQSTLNKPLKSPPAQPGQDTNSPETIPIKRIMWTLGSKQNEENFVIAQTALNRYKLAIWNGHDPVVAADMRSAIDNISQKDDACKVLCKLRLAIAVIHYLNDSNVHKKWATIYNLQRKEWERAVQQHPTPIKMIKAFDEINALHRNEMTKKVKKFVNDWGNNLRIHLYGNSQKWAVEARDATVIFDQIMQTLKVKDDGFDGA